MMDEFTQATLTMQVHQLRQQLVIKQTHIENLNDHIASVTAERDELRQICHDAYEVWAGSEGIPEPKYASEAYLYQLLINMRDEVKRGLAKLGADKTVRVDPHWPTIRMDISEGVCGTCKLGAKNCDVDLDGHCGGLK